MISGTVKFYNSEQGFGLIRRTDGEKDVRFLISELRAAGLTKVEEGQRVSFDTQANPNTGKITASTIKLV